MRQAIEVGEIAHIETASEELTGEFLLFAIESGLLESWADTFPDPQDDNSLWLPRWLVIPYNTKPLN